MPSVPPHLPAEVIRRILLVGMPPSSPDILSSHIHPNAGYNFLKTACLVNSAWKVSNELREGEGSRTTCVRSREALTRAGFIALEISRLMREIPG